MACWTSTLKRTIETANYLPFPKLRWKALDEIHAGLCDGMTWVAKAGRLPAAKAGRTAASAAACPGAARAPPPHLLPACL